MSAQDCLPQAQVCRTRVALLDSDGTPSGGASSMYVSGALVKATIKPVYKDGTEIEERTGCDEVALNFRSDDTFVRGDIELDFVTPDPLLHQILISNGKLLTGAWGNGWAFPPIGKVTGQLSLEFWAKRINDGIQDPDFPWAWWAVPLGKNMRLGDRALENAGQHAIISGQAYENANYFDGPNNDWPASSDRVAQWIPATDADLPAVTCAYETVVPS